MAGVALVLGMTASSAVAAQKYEWRMQTMQTPGSANYKADQAFVSLVQKMSNGAITIRLFPRGEIVASKNIAKAVGLGTIELGSTWDGYQLGMLPQLTFLELIPQFTLGEFEEKYTFLYQRGAIKKINEGYAKYKVHWLAPKFMEYTKLLSRVPIRKVEDFKGKRIRIAGSNAIFYQQLGAKTLYVPTGEIYTGLQLGTFDAVGWTGEDMMVRLGWHEIAKYVIEPPYKKLGVACILINAGLWNGLPEHLKAIIESAGLVAGIENLSYDAEGNAKAKGVMKKSGVEFISLNRPEDTQAMYKAALFTWNSMEEKSPASAEASKMLKAFVKEREYDWVK